MIYLSIIDNLNCEVLSTVNPILEELDNSNIQSIELEEWKVILKLLEEDEETNRETAAAIVSDLIRNQLDRFTCVINNSVPSDLPDAFNEY
jgi:hypothetical protein